jgi:Txe/YoeB family toxin of Txe-Axe toxin-antitoxin module
MKTVKGVEEIYRTVREIKQDLFSLIQKLNPSLKPLYESYYWNFENAISDQIKLVYAIRILRIFNTLKETEPLSARNK